MKKNTNTTTETARVWIDAQTVNEALTRAAEKQTQQQTARNYRAETDRAAIIAAAQTDAQTMSKYANTETDRAAIAKAAADRAAQQRAAEAAEADKAIEADKAKNRRKRAFVVYYADGQQQRIETTQTAAQLYIATGAARVRQVVLTDTDYIDIARRVVYIVLKRGNAYSNGAFFSELLRAAWTDANKQDLVADAYTALIEYADADAETQYKAMFAAVNHTIYKNRAPHDGKVAFIYDWNTAELQNVTQTINDYCNKPQAARRVAWTEYVASLTQRQRDILRLKAQGHSVRQIAKKMCVTPRAVQKHIEAIRRKAAPYTQAARSSAEAQQTAQRAAAETDARLTQTARLLKNAQK